MSNKAVVVEGCQLAFRNPAAQGLIQVTGTTTCPVQSGGKRAYNRQLVFTITGYSVGSFTQTTPYVGTISGTSQKAFSQGFPFVLDGDSVSVEITGVVGPVPSTAVDEVYVVDPGQNVLKVT